MRWVRAAGTAMVHVYRALGSPRGATLGRIPAPPDFARRRIVLRDESLHLRRAVGLVCLAYTVLWATVLLVGGTPTLLPSTSLSVLWWPCAGIAAWAFGSPGLSQILDVDRRVLLQSFNSLMGVRTVAIPFDDFTHIAADIHYIDDEFGGQIPKHPPVGASQHRRTDRAWTLRHHCSLPASTDCRHGARSRRSHHGHRNV